MSQEALITKPASGHWTDAYPELGRGPVSLEDCVSEEFYEKEREHVFKKTWLYMGRVERVPRSGSYFTREMKFLNTSIIIVRGKDDVIRAFHNICPHRGQQNAVERRPVRGSAGPRAVAVLPLPRLALQPGRLTAFGHPQGSAAGLRRRQLPGAGDSMRGMGRLHLHQSQPRQHRVGASTSSATWRKGLEGYPFEGPHQVYRFKAELQCNWKIFVDGFAESYHGPYLHASSFGNLTAEAKEALNKPNPFTDALCLPTQGPAPDVLVRRRALAKDAVLQAHRVCDGGQRGRTLDQAGRPWSHAAGNQPHAVGEARLRLVPVLPKLRAHLRRVRLHGPHPLAHWAALAHLRNRDVSTSPRKPTRNGSGQEMTVTFLNDIILEDASPSEGLQAMLNSGALTHFTMNDEEILLRHLHKVVGDYVEAGEKAKAER